MTSYSLWPALTIVSDSPVMAVCSLGSREPAPTASTSICLVPNHGWSSAELRLVTVSLITPLQQENQIHRMFWSKTHMDTEWESKPSFLTPSPMWRISMRRSASVMLKGRRGGMQPGVINKNVYDLKLLSGSSSCIPRSTTKTHPTGRKC